MRIAKVRFNSTNQIIHFVNIVENYGMDMNLQEGNRVVDAKSLLGVINFGIGKTLDLMVLDDSCTELLKEIEFCLTA